MRNEHNGSTSARLAVEAERMDVARVQIEAGDFLRDEALDGWLERWVAGAPSAELRAIYECGRASQLGSAN